MNEETQRKANMKYNRKLNRIERKAEQQAKLARDLHGEGEYLYLNNTNSELRLVKEVRLVIPDEIWKDTPKKEIKTRFVPPKTKFLGDSYFMALVRSNDVRLVEVIKTPEQERQEQLMAEKKLILDQPDLFTEQGKVEHVQPAAPKKGAPTKLNESPHKQQPPDKLLVEDPDFSGIEIINS